MKQQDGKRVEAVALIILSPQETIFTLKELSGKPEYEKVAGMVSVPIETMERRETHFEALERLLIEEVGKDNRLWLGYPEHLGDVLMDFSTGKRSRIFCYALSSRLEFQASPLDKDIEPFGWLTVNELFTHPQRRKEVEPLLGLLKERGW